MATQTIEFVAPTGETITAKLYAAGSDTVAATASSVTEQTNRKGVYYASVTSTLSGVYRLVATDASDTPLATWWVDLLNASGTYIAYEISPKTIGDAFLAHVLTKGAANTVERAFWQSSKTSASLTGEVLASGGNTATSFLTDITIDDFAGQVLAMVSGALAGEARAIQSVSSGVVTLQKPLTATPSAADEFVVVPSQVYAVSEIQSGLSTLTAAQVNAELLDVLATDLFAELAAVPAASSSLKDKISFLFMLARNKVTQTASTQTLFADNTTTPVAASATSDVGGTFTRGEFA